MMKNSCCPVAVAAMLMAGASLAEPAQPVAAVEDEAIAAANEKASGTEHKDGWSAGLTLGGSASFLHNSKVVGQDDGVTLALGGVAGARAGFVFGDHEWRNVASLEHMQTKTPIIDVLLKSADMLDVSSLYLYRLPFLSWVGPYARARGFTPVFPGQGVRSVDVTTRRISVSGTVIDRLVKAQTPFPLTGFFEPFTLSEGVGGFVEPLQTDYLSLGLKLGAAGQHMLARDGYVTSDDPATPEIELMQLRPIHSMGAETEVAVAGAIVKDRLTWGVTMNLYYPVLISVPTELDLVERTHVDTVGNVSLKIAEGVSVDYVLRARRAPFVLNDWQVQSSLLLTLGLALL